MPRWRGGVALLFSLNPSRVGVKVGDYVSEVVGSIVVLQRLSNQIILTTLVSISTL